MGIRSTARGNERFLLRRCNRICFPADSPCVPERGLGACARDLQNPNEASSSPLFVAAVPGAVREATEFLLRPRDSATFSRTPSALYVRQNLESVRARVSGCGRAWWPGLSEAPPKGERIWMHPEKAAEPAILVAASRLLYLTSRASIAYEDKKKKKKANGVFSALKQSCLADAGPVTLSLF